MVADDDSSPEVTLCKQQAAYKFHLCHCYTDQVSCDWWRPGHVTTIPVCDWSRARRPVTVRRLPRRAASARSTWRTPTPSSRCPYPVICIMMRTHSQDIHIGESPFLLGTVTRAAISRCARVLVTSAGLLEQLSVQHTQALRLGAGASLPRLQRLSVTGLEGEL